MKEVVVVLLIGFVAGMVVLARAGAKVAGEIRLATNEVGRLLERLVRGIEKN